jgi:hypothetical protein
VAEKMARQLSMATRRELKECDPAASCLALNVQLSLGFGKTSKPQKV